MKEDEKRKMKNNIKEEIARLDTEIARLVENIKPIPPDNAIGRLTRMEAINAKNMDEANLRTARTKLVQLQRALVRVDDPDYGICLDCERPIPFKRLLLVPESRRCVRCLSR